MQMYDYFGTFKRGKQNYFHFTIFIYSLHMLLPLDNIPLVLFTAT